MRRCRLSAERTGLGISSTHRSVPIEEKQDPE